MADQRKGGISWTDETWNPIRGCSMAGPECLNCYAMWVAAVRMSKAGQAYHGLATLAGGDAEWTGRVVTVPDKLDEPLHWKRPRLIFVNSMSDLGHPKLTDDQRDAIVGMMALADQHTYQVLTKHGHRTLPSYLEGLKTRPSIVGAVLNWKAAGKRATFALQPAVPTPDALKQFWPLANVWWGLSAGTQRTMDLWFPYFRAIRPNARVVWLSMEPLLEPIDMTPPEHRNTNVNQQDWLQDLDWLVVGGESCRLGGNARPMHPDWVRSLRDRAVHRTDMGRPWSLPFHFKQWGDWTPGVNVDRTQGTVATATYFGGQWVFGHEDLARTDGHVDDEPDLYHVGKEAAGHLLDGTEWREWPLGFQGPERNS